MGVLSVSQVKEAFDAEVEDPLAVEVVVEAVDWVEIVEPEEVVDTKELELDDCDVTICELEVDEDEVLVNEVVDVVPWFVMA